ncbi:STAS domain-containing protein ['Paenibacillus yunnanensis' Narsing Rao et al. 2020]|uniref:STAS domain-containing protein n=1 Tax=Paenibacillus tengchongensis TaxID=2608684 RepID=UPI00124BD831|nr:STAS domain-containing protein [Paenibacillus tengchongensis]
MTELRIAIPEMFSVDEAGMFRDQTRTTIEQGTVNLLLDFAGCRFIDSTGLGVIVSTYKKCAENGGTIRLTALHPNVLKVFELTRLTNVFDII